MASCLILKKLILLTNYRLKMNRRRKNSPVIFQLVNLRLILNLNGVYKQTNLEKLQISHKTCRGPGGQNVNKSKFIHF